MEGSLATETSVITQTNILMERNIIEKVYCQSIKYHDSSRCIIQKKYYFSS